VQLIFDWLWYPHILFKNYVFKHNFIQTKNQTMYWVCTRTDHRWKIIDYSNFNIKNNVCGMKCERVGNYVSVKTLHKIKKNYFNKINNGILLILICRCEIEIFLKLPHKIRLLPYQIEICTTYYQFWLLFQVEIVWD
jgi:hypothetical protein